MFIIKRQFSSDPEIAVHEGMGSVWYSPTAYVVKWSVLLALFVTFFLWITIGYYHARKRVKAGLPPLTYHRWLVPRSQRYPQPPQQQNNFGYYAPNNYGMHAMVDPPPDLPPIYQPPLNGNKTDVSQNSQHTSRQEPQIELQGRSRTTG